MTGLTARSSGRKACVMRGSLWKGAMRPSEGDEALAEGAGTRMEDGRMTVASG